MSRIFLVGENVDTDQLAPGQYMRGGIEALAAHCLEAIRPDFAGSVQPGDVLVAISVSGTSPNIVSAVSEARELGLSVISMTGRTGGTLAAMSDVTIMVPSDSMEVVEDAHLIVSHSLCVATREHLAMPVPGESAAPAKLAS